MNLHMHVCVSIVSDLLSPEMGDKAINASYIIIRLGDREFQKQLGNRFYQEVAKNKTKEKYINH